MILLIAAGRKAVFGTSGRSLSLARQIDRAYIRLSLAKLKWTMARPGETRENLTQYDTTGRMTEVHTDQGLALVTGSIRNGGISRQTIENVARRMRSTALFKAFNIVLLTPSSRKGHHHAHGEAAYLTLKTILPVNPAYPAVKRIKQLPAARIMPDNEPYLAGEAWKSDPKFSELPDLTKMILQLNRRERIDHAVQSLECDGALTTAQLKRYYGLSLNDIVSRPYVETILRPTHGDQATEPAVTFVTATRKMANLDDTVLAHRVGTGEMRHQMGVFSEERHWKAEERELLKFEEPDAYYYDENGQIHAIEFDTGSYTANVIDDKLSTFQDRGFTSIHWGVTTSTRKVNLTDKIRHRLGSDVLLCEWWK
ncbi:hypothetical protein Q0M94_17935 (plasmid) [Deinococcus radiomollis]|uniref:hypothetical protein n=1 Tax=Deinococcus radiomollis TaxID=468916 RepID=UPI0038926A0A